MKVLFDNDLTFNSPNLTMFGCGEAEGKQWRLLMFTFLWLWDRVLILGFELNLLLIITGIVVHILSVGGVQQLEATGEKGVDLTGCQDDDDESLQDSRVSSMFLDRRRVPLWFGCRPSRLKISERFKKVVKLSTKGMPLDLQ